MSITTSPSARGACDPSRIARDDPRGERRARRSGSAKGEGPTPGAARGLAGRPISRGQPSNRALARRSWSVFRLGARRDRPSRRWPRQWRPAYRRARASRPSFTRRHPLRRRVRGGLDRRAIVTALPVSAAANPRHHRQGQRIAGVSSVKERVQPEQASFLRGVFGKNGPRTRSVCAVCRKCVVCNWHEARFEAHWIGPGGRRAFSGGTHGGSGVPSNRDISVVP